MVKLKLTSKYLIAFYFLIMLYASLHELVHHFVGYFICGDWGYKTFNYFSTACEKEKITYFWIVCIPPLITAYKAIENENKLKWFLLYFTLLPLVIWAPIFGFLEYLLVNRHFLDSRIIGIALLFIINEIITIIGYWFTKKYLNPNQTS